MLHLLTLKVGQKYDVCYVNKLYGALSRQGLFCSEACQFHCYTDDPEGLLPEINVIPLTLREEISYLQFYKIDFHAMEQFSGEPCLILDIDLIPLEGAAKCILKPLPSEGPTLEAPQCWWQWSDWETSINSGYLKFVQGETTYLKETFDADPLHWQHHFADIGLMAPGFGEQVFVRQTFKGKVQFLPLGTMGKYVLDNSERISRYVSMWKERVSPKLPVGEEGGDYVRFDERGWPSFHPRVSFVHFAGQGRSKNQIHQANEQWIHEVW